MRHRSLRTARHRVIGGLAAALLGTAGLTLPAAAQPAAARPAPSEQTARAAETTLSGDGLALTPPMGFNNWNSTHCRAEFNEAMVKGIADLFVSKGLKDAGYTYVNLDDCWALPQRDANGKLVADSARFPNGIKAVADYIHSKGLKIGIYTSAGTKTCNTAGFPGALGHERSDAQQFADWGIDYLKYDNCNNQGVDAKQRYRTMRDALKAASETTGRPIVYSICEWGQNKPWEWAADVGQLWRTTGDISDSWGSMLSIAKENLPLAPYAGPGHWNDPDMLEVGNGGMTDTEYRSHFSLWSVMAAPLLIGTDLRKADASTYQILGNRDVIAVDQDPLGKQGTVLSSEGGRWVISKELADGGRAVALFNETDQPQRIATTAARLGLPPADGYRLRDLWQHQDHNTAGSVAATVPAHGTVLYRVSADKRWASYPPAAELRLGASPFTEAGTTAPVETALGNLGGTPAHQVRVRLTGPDGWRVRTTSPTQAATLPTGSRLATRWQVTAPQDATPGAYELTLRADYRSARGGEVSTGLPIPVHVVVAPPTGATYASDLPWLNAVNGWGPVEKDTSVGENAAGDGHPLTLDGTAHAKGLGVHAPSEVTYYTGGHCTAFTAKVGVDDEEGTAGTVAFEVWADGAKVLSTGTLTNADPAKTVTAAVDGATTVRLVTTDGGDDITSDHGDWADAAFTC
ncbi:NPCBM/NEW2 domain-containing protein [Streptomyces sp. NBRC 110028]|uniref:NPCBM/NEW2 domain-containing protein n=1 Tax=Streptomyces sp. NBRC 110028 TaxID=1621260 RepID=UPI0006E236EC|nr:NPCBM/NEW2 domain-containing protein [Streptomyces sp. NBRC 110028]